MRRTGSGGDGRRCLISDARRNRIILFNANGRRCESCPGDADKVIKNAPRSAGDQCVVQSSAAARARPAISLLFSLYNRRFAWRRLPRASVRRWPLQRPPRMSGNKQQSRAILISIVRRLHRLHNNFKCFVFIAYWFLHKFICVFVYALALAQPHYGRRPPRLRYPDSPVRRPDDGVDKDLGAPFGAFK